MKVESVRNWVPYGAPNRTIFEYPISVSDYSIPDLYYSISVSDYSIVEFDYSIFVADYSIVDFDYSIFDFDLSISDFDLLISVLHIHIHGVIYSQVLLPTDQGLCTYACYSHPGWFVHMVYGLCCPDW